MKRISRLMALLLAFLLLSPTAFATESAIKINDLNAESYALMVAAAEDANEAVGKTAVTNEDNVEVNSHHYNTGWFGSKVIDTLIKGTVVTITSVNTGLADGAFDSHWYGVSYEQNGETRTGYIKTKYLTIQKPAPELTYTLWDGVSATVTLSCNADGADSCEWQRGTVGADEIAWETIEGATSAELTLDATAENLRYTYRCIVKDADGVQTPSEGAALITPELAQWISTNDTAISTEMLALATQATSLDSMMLVGDRLIHVRTGNAFAAYNAETGVLTHIELNVPFGKVVDGKLMSLTAEAEPVA